MLTIRTGRTMTDPDTNRYSVHDPFFPNMGSGEIRVSSEDDCVVIQITNEFYLEQSHVDLHDPEQIRQLAARLIAEGKKLQDRQDIQQGIGGDQ